MISEILQEEKNKVLQILAEVSETIEKLQFMKIPNYNISMDFKRKWDLHLRKFFADIDNYQKNEFPIVVLGRWNSGKSTLINAILGEELLPSANKEMTSILTKIYYGNSKEVIAQIEEGEYQSIPLSELKDYVNFRGNKYSESLKQIDIITDSSFLKSGISIIDTRIKQYK